LTIASLVLHEGTSNLAPERVGRVQEGSLVSINGRAFPDQIGCHGFLKLRPLEQLPGGKCHNSEENLQDVSFCSSLFGALDGP